MGTLPASEAPRLERRLTEESLEEILGAERQVISLEIITCLKADPSRESLTIYQSEIADGKRWEFQVGEKLEPLLRTISHQAGGNWEDESIHQRYPGVFFLSLFVTLVIGGLTYLLYLGIQAGIITRGPALLAMIVNLFGTTGLAITGACLSLLCLGLGIKAVLQPTKVTILRKR